MSKRENNPLVEVFGVLWNVIKEILHNFSSFNDIVESTNRIVKHSLKILMDKFDIYLIDFLKIVVEGYQKNPISSFIYSVEFCLTHYCKRREYEGVLLETFEVMTEQTNLFLPDI